MESLNQLQESTNAVLQNNEAVKISRRYTNITLTILGKGAEGPPTEHVTYQAHEESINEASIAQYRWDDRGRGNRLLHNRGRALGDKGRKIILMTHCEMLDPLMAANDGPNEAHKSYYI